MKRTLLISLLLSFWSSAPASAQTTNIPDGFKVTPLMRSTHFVRDVDESLKLYRDILGLRVRFEQTFKSDEWDDILGIGDKTTRVVHLQSGDYVFANVAFFQFLGDTQPPAPEPRNFVKTGDAALVFVTNDIFTINKQVKAAGYTIVSEPIILFPQEGADTQAYESLFFDRDGILVNLTQFDVPNSEVPK
ncbi:MAG: VOC family protein [Rhodospirillaceae bacterium]|nr:VOC family protein [Rhodospirillaceae bacterium]